mgnify:CR=1 FL=1
MKKTALLLSVMLLLSVFLCGCRETAYTPTLFTANGTRWSIGFSSVEIEVPEDKMALSMYRKAVESLKDIDRHHYVRDYYHMP